MKLKLSLLIFSILQVIIVNYTVAQSSNNLIVEISGIEEVKGKMSVYLYSQSDGFPSKPEKADNRIVVSVKSNRVKVMFANVKHGTYAVSVFQDINSNGKVDANFLGKSKEPVGASNNVKGSLGRPKFEDAKFLFDKYKKIEIRLN